MKFLCALLLVGIVCAVGAQEETCTPVENKDYASCACKMSDSGKVVNLGPLQNSSQVPRYTVVGPREWSYSYNPCSGFDMFAGENNTKLGYKPCLKVAAARWVIQTTHQCFSLGDQKSAEFQYGRTEPPSLTPSNLTVTFTYTNDTLTKNQAVISLICNKNVTKDMSVFKFINTTYDVHTKYYFSLESECCCPGACGIPPPPLPTPSSSKGGVDKWIIIGLAIGAAVIFLLFLVASCFCCRKRSGYTSV